jgi:hypothetical protein
MQPLLLAEGADALSRKPEKSKMAVHLPGIDTIVVPAHNDRFERMFMKKKRWAAVRIDKGKRDQLRFIAAYRTAPEAVITHYAEIDTFKRYRTKRKKDKGKVVIKFLSSPEGIGPIHRTRNSKIKLRSSRYTNFHRLAEVKNLDDFFA